MKSVGTLYKRFCGIIIKCESENKIQEKGLGEMYVRSFIMV